MLIYENSIIHICETAKIPSFSTYEERLHPYIDSLFSSLPGGHKIDCPGNNLIYQQENPDSDYTIALAAHLDKINHYGKDFPDELPVKKTNDFIEGAMDDCAGLGILLAIAEKSSTSLARSNLLFFFSEMEESKGLKEHPELLKNKGEGYKHGMGARRIAQTCIKQGLIPDEVITIDTTPLFKGESGVALYSRHWEYTELEPSRKLVKLTEQTEKHFQDIDPNILLANNTNDFLHYGYELNRGKEKNVISVALEPAIFPYHQRGERVFISDIKRVLDILQKYIKHAR